MTVAVLEVQERGNNLDLDKIFESPAEELYLTKYQMKKLAECCDKLIKKFEEAPDEDIKSGKLTKQDGINWIKECQYESIAIADLLAQGKKQQEEKNKAINDEASKEG